MRGTILSCRTSGRERRGVFAFCFSSFLAEGGNGTLRKILVGGDFLLASMVAVTCTKLVLKTSEEVYRQLMIEWEERRDAALRQKKILMKQNSLSRSHSHQEGREAEEDQVEKNLGAGLNTQPILTSAPGGGGVPRAGSKDFFEDERELPVQLTLSS